MSPGYGFGQAELKFRNRSAVFIFQKVKFPFFSYQPMNFDNMCFHGQWTFMVAQLMCMFPSSAGDITCNITEVIGECVPAPI